MESLNRKLREMSINVLKVTKQGYVLHQESWDAAKAGIGLEFHGSVGAADIKGPYPGAKIHPLGNECDDNIPHLT